NRSSTSTDARFMAVMCVPGRKAHRPVRPRGRRRENLIILTTPNEDYVHVAAGQRSNRPGNVVVENHGGLSSDGEWLASVIERVDHPLAGTLPDFGNFCIEWEGNNWKSGCAREYDRYKGVRELMPYAEAVSAKSKGFDDDGTAAQTDFERMMQIVLDAGYHGHVGIEYEGDGLSEYEGIRATKRLLKRVRRTLRDA
ncbi:MAG: hypothetical protein BRD30_02125, partial [Bacteroidetes bacterium QH_2_63_10]